ncbi:MAG: hydroxyphenylacetyl-CoA thioesterase PaaI [Alphaproteobacteria bacterium]|nr:hydroxyphenylacetyl-CoA thioesterase PaaI [Alphaproteobacteria bacterium]
MGGEQAQGLAEAVGKAIYQKDHAVRAMGIVLEDIGPGRARMAMVVRRDMLNSHQTCHGGATFTLADACFGYACNSYNHVTVGASCDINYPTPAHEGDRLTAVAEERHRKGRGGVYDVTVTNQKGEVVALFRGHSRRLDGTLI